MAAQDAGLPRVLVVFDFDMSLVNDDSDELFCRAFCPELAARLATPPFTPPPRGWAALMDSVMTEFHDLKPHIQRETILSTLARIEVFPETLDAIQYAVQHHQANVAIMSDGNTAFIQSFLDHHRLSAHVSEVHANPGHWEETPSGTLRLRVKPYHGDDQEPHGCEQCPRNLCKGFILDQLRQRDEYDVILYVGDGIGDFCPSTRLSSCDVVLARAANASGRRFGLMHCIESSPDTIRARVVPWSSGVDILDNFKQILGINSNK